MGVNGRLFEIVRLRGGAMNFDPQVITLFKEARNLLWLNFQVPHAVSLMETVRTYWQTLDLVESNKGIEWLVAERRNEAQRMVSRGERRGFYCPVFSDFRCWGFVNADMNIRWDYFVNQYDAVRYVSSVDGRDHRHIQFVREFASVVSVLQDKTNSVVDLCKGILRAAEDLATCLYTSGALSELLARYRLL